MKEAYHVKNMLGNNHYDPALQRWGGSKNSDIIFHDGTCYHLNFQSPQRPQRALEGGLLGQRDRVSFIIVPNVTTAPNARMAAGGALQTPEEENIRSSSPSSLLLGYLPPPTQDPGAFFWHAPFTLSTQTTQP